LDGRPVRLQDRAIAAEDAVLAREHLPGERLLEGDLQLVELGDVRDRNRPHDDEEGHQERDHVRIGQEPALVVRVPALTHPGSPPAPVVVAAGAHAASSSSAGSGAAFGAALAFAPFAASASSPRASGGMKVSSFSASIRGLSPDWIECTASSSIV